MICNIYRIFPISIKNTKNELFKTAPWRYKLESDGGKDRAVREGNEKGNPYLIAYDTGGGGKKWLCVKSISIIEQMIQQMPADKDYSMQLSDMINLQNYTMILMLKIFHTQNVLKYAINSFKHGVNSLPNI